MRSDLLTLIHLIVNEQNTTHADNSITDDSHLFFIANAFKQSLKKPLPKNWQTLACFDDLSHWFAESPHIENHIKWAMCCWYEKFDLLISRNIAPRDTIVLGHALIDTPYQFAAFIYWLCEHEVSSEELINSYLLHRYFAYHCAMMDEVHETYALLINISEKVNLFLEDAKNTTCGLRGFINNRENNNYYSSYSVFGEIVYHAEKCVELPMHCLQTPADQILPWKTHLLQNHAVKFYQLFGWQFIDSLNPNTLIHELCFSKILNTQAIREPVLLEFEQRALNHTNHSLTNIFFRHIKKSMEKHNKLDNISLIKKIPFLIHAVTLNHYEKTFIEEIILQLCTNQKYYTINHIPLLVVLYHNTSDILPQKIIRMIFDLILTFENTIPDNILNILDNIKIPLMPFIENEINCHEAKLNHLISLYVVGSEKYVNVEQLWISKLSMINLFRFLYPSICNQMDDALYHKFSFKMRILLLVFSHQQINNSPIDFAPTLQEICTNQIEIRRLLQNVLMKNNPVLFIQNIITYVVSNDSPADFFYKPFGDQKSLIQYAVDSKNEILFHEIVSVKGITEENWRTLFSEAIKDKSQIQILCAFKNRKNLSDQVIIDAAKMAARMQHWDIVQLLCGLQNDSTKNPPIQLNNNVKLYLELLNKVCDENLNISLLNITNEHHDTLLHLAAKTRHLPTVSQCLNLLCTHYSVFKLNNYLNQINSDGQLAHCPSRCPTAHQINSQLSNVRQRFLNFPCHEIAHNKRQRLESHADDLDMHRRTDGIVRLWTASFPPHVNAELADTITVDNNSATQDEEESATPSDFHRYF